MDTRPYYRFEVRTKTGKYKRYESPDASVIANKRKMIARNGWTIENEYWDDPFGTLKKKPQTQKPVSETKRKIFIVDGPADKVRKAKLTAPRPCKVKVQSQGHDLGGGVVRSGRRQHLKLY